MLNFFFENVRMGLKNLGLHKLRSLLTALGIIFGVAAVIGMVAIGEGAKEQALVQMRQLGAQNVLVRSQPPPESTETNSANSRVLEYGLTRDDLRRLEDLNVFKEVVPLRDTEQKVTRGDRRANANAMATTPGIFNIISLQLARGRVFTQVQYDAAEAVCVLGAGSATQLFPYDDPIGQTIEVGTGSTGVAVLTVIGVLKPTGLGAGSDSAGIIQRDVDQDVYFPLTVSEVVFNDMIVKRQSGAFIRKKIQLSEIWLRTDSVQHVEALAEVVRNVVAGENQLGQKRADVVVKAPIEILRKAEAVQRQFNFIMGGIASFSLVIGGIGIMNIMLASVTERTKEIGIRRALGAKRKHITLQFLIETTAISLTGGLIGIALGSAFAKGLPGALRLIGTDSYRTSIAAWSVVGSFVVSGLIGVLFGLYPAIRAARMNPIDALRHE